MFQSPLGVPSWVQFNPLASSPDPPPFHPLPGSFFSYSRIFCYCRLFYSSARKCLLKVRPTQLSHLGFPPFRMALWTPDYPTWSNSAQPSLPQFCCQHSHTFKLCFLLKNHRACSLMEVTIITIIFCVLD